jgi:hypothetical protein
MGDDGAKVTVLLQEALALWQDSPASLPPFAHSYGVAEQAAKEMELGRFVESVQAELQRLPRTRPERLVTHERITAAFVRFAKAGLDFEDRHLDLLLGGGFAAIGTELARQARRFDPAVSTADIFQASRNAWTACGLQMMLGHQMRLTPAIFAYSMLYPYSDNYMDDPGVFREAKLGFSARFGRRLGGETVAAANDRERGIWRLVDMIEEQYPRAAWPQVFDSLLAIHHAQENSLRLLRQSTSAGPADVLRLSFEKGGASVLADAYLAAGSLSGEEAQFAFNWGVVLQLADDLQDVQQDSQNRVLTLFSQAAGEGLLDKLTNRTMQFAQRVAHQMQRLPGPECRTLKELVQRSAGSLLVRSAGEAGELHSQEYLAELETHSPFRFSFLNRQRSQLARRSGLLTKLFEAFLEGDEDEPAFPLLPSSLMPRF